VKAELKSYLSMTDGEKGQQLHHTTDKNDPSMKSSERLSPAL
jgi:hypothetical protein